MRLSKLGRVGVLSQERTARGESLYVGDQRDKGGGSGIDSGRPFELARRDQKRKSKLKQRRIWCTNPISLFLGI